MDRIVKAKEGLERETLGFREIIVDRDSALKEKETQLVHLQKACEELEVKLARTDQTVKETEGKMADLQSEMSERQAEWDAEKLRLEEACVSVYEDGFLKAKKQATTLAPDLDASLFDIDKEDEPAEDPSLELAPAPKFIFLFL